MSTRKKTFSESDKVRLRQELRLACEQSWATKGYKKTSISFLTAELNISTGSFYLLYLNKEELFCDTLAAVQERLKSELTAIILKQPNKAGFVAAIKWLFKEYDERKFLYDFSNPDFQLFLSKLPPEQVAKFAETSLSFSDYLIETAQLELRLPKEQVYAGINALLYTVSMPDNLDSHRQETFGLLIDGLIDHLFI